MLTAMRALADKLAPGRIRFPGCVDDVAGLLASAQLFVLASDHEGLPLSVLEAMRAGLPIVASDLPGIREQFDTAPAALIAPDDDASMADTLTALAADPDLRRAMGEAARKRWEQAFGIEPMVKATWQIYQRALGNLPLPVKGV